MIRRPILGKTGKPYDFGPFEVKIEAPHINRTEEFNDLPSEARFPYAYDRASRYASRMQRQFPRAEISILGPDGALTPHPAPNTITS